MKLMQLRYFQAACRHHSISSAAEVLHVSQPSVSAAIKELETEFHVTLFNRQYRGFSLTQEGSVFLEQVNSLLEHADRVHQIMDDLGQQRKLLRLGLPPMIGSVLLPVIYHSFLRDYPDVNLRIYEGGQHDVIHQLSANNLDLAFLPHSAPPDAGFHAIPIMMMETVFCVTEEHPLADRSFITPEDLDGLPLVMFRNSHHQNAAVKERFTRSGLTPNVILDAAQLSTVLTMITSQSAAGFLVRNIAEQHPELRAIPFSPPLEVQVSLIWRKGSFLFSDMERFIRYMKELHF